MVGRRIVQTGGILLAIGLGGLKPASDYKLIRRFRLSRRCRSRCRDFRLATGTLRLADYLGRARSDRQLIIGDPSAN